jgi:hypothetical protein
MRSQPTGCGRLLLGPATSPYRVLRLAVAFLAATAALAPASLEAAFTAPVTLSFPGQHASDAQVAMDPGGNAVFAWQRIDATTDCGGSGCSRIQTRVRSAAGALSATQTLSVAGQSADDVQVGVDSSGNAVFVWSRRDGTTDCGGFSCFRVQARVRSAAGALSGIHILSAAGQNAFDAQVAVDPNGNAVFAWSRQDGTTDCGGFSCSRIQARVRSAAGALSTTQTLSDPGQNATDPEVAVDPNGNAVFAWQRSDGTAGCGGTGCSRIQGRVRSAAGTLSVVQTLSAAGQNASDAQVAVDPNGKAVFAWQRPDGTTGCGGSGCVRIGARARSAAGALSAPQTLSIPGQNAIEPLVGVDASGNALFVWQRSGAIAGCAGAGCSAVQSRARTAAGALSATQGISAPNQVGGDPELAVDPNGNAVVVWSGSDGTNNRVHARTRSAAGVLGAIQTLSDAGQSALEPEIGVDPNGNAAAVWTRSDGTTGCGGGCSRVQAAIGP